MRSVAEIRRDMEGFEKPSCPNCQPGEPALDDDGFFCERCGDQIANGAEFDGIVAELCEAKRVRRAE